jgi:hypothetical protein
LAEQPAQLVACVPATAAVEQLYDRDVGEPEGIVEFTVGEQAAVGSNPGSVEFELDPAIEWVSEAALWLHPSHTPRSRSSTRTNTMIPIAESG